MALDRFSLIGANIRSRFQRETFTFFPKMSPIFPNLLLPIIFLCKKQNKNCEYLSIYETLPHCKLVAQAPDVIFF